MYLGSCGSTLCLELVLVLSRLAPIGKALDDLNALDGNVRDVLFHRARLPLSPYAARPFTRNVAVRSSRQAAYLRDSFAGLVPFRIPPNLLKPA